ncbi:hypothetical protein HMPREF0239_01411 [Clostridium sp. ATCC BAA-442]|nr:hypothetical protein HMPREF0239_01411 [Clostridium sp. ATCC BAA-442]
MARLIKPVVLSPWASAWAWTALRRSGVILTLISTNFSMYFLFALFCASVVRGFSSLTFLPPFRGCGKFPAPLPSCQHYSTKNNIRPDIKQTNIRPYIC